LSVAEALRHGAIANNIDLDIKWIQSEDVNAENVRELLSDVDGILVPGGFGDRGVDGKIEAIKYARENNIPFLGICFGMQLAVVEFARNVAKFKDAHSSEINPDTPYPVIDLMPEQKDAEATNGSMRLGLYPCKIKEDTLAFKIYNDEIIYERHRHKFEFNNEYRDKLVEEGLTISGVSPDERL